MNQWSGPDPQQPDLMAEQVVYQNPLLFLKIWELQSEPGDAYPDHPDPWLWHYHREVEFIAILQGQLGVQTKWGYTVLSPGDVMIVGSSQPHRTHRASADPVRYIVFQVNLLQHFDQSTLPLMSAFAELTRPLDPLNSIFAENEKARREAHALILDIYRETQGLAKGYELAVSADIKRLLLLLIRFDREGLLQTASEADLLRLRPALDYVENHYHEKITVRQMCRLLHLSYHYFIKLFHKVVGMSFVDYVNYKRVKTAEWLLLTHDLSIAEVAERVGIPNMSQFYKLFRRYNHCTPKAFLQQMRSGGTPNATLSSEEARDPAPQCIPALPASRPSPAG